MWGCCWLLLLFVCSLRRSSSSAVMITPAVHAWAYLGTAVSILAPCASQVTLNADSCAPTYTPCFRNAAHVRLANSEVVKQLAITITNTSSSIVTPTDQELFVSPPAPQNNVWHKQYYLLFTCQCPLSIPHSCTHVQTPVSSSSCCLPLSENNCFSCSASCRPVCLSVKGSNVT